MILDLLACEVRLLRVENLATTLKHLNLTLSAACLTTTGRRQEDAILIKCGHQRRTLRYIDGLVAIDFDVDITARAEELLSYKQDDNQEEYHNKENSDTCKYK